MSFVIFILLVTQCNKVKYPENSGKINNPQKIDLMRGFITEYKVNGIDSLDLLNKFIIAPPALGIKAQSIDFQIKDEHNKNTVLNTNFGEITYSWNSGYKYIYVSHSPYADIITRNIFLINGTNWQILKLVKKTTVGNQLKIKAEINGNTYEIQFN